MSKYHVRIDGVGYLIRPGGYVRGVDGGGEAGWQRWEQGDWRGGDGRALDGETGGRGDGARWWRGYGVDVGTAGRVTVGPGMEVSRTTAWDGVSAMAAWKGKLYAVSESSAEVWAFDGTNWSLSYTAASAGLSCLGYGFGELMVGSAVDGKVYAWDAGWYLKYTLSAFASRVDAIVPYGLYNPTDGKTVPRVAIATRDFAGLNAQLSFYTADGTQEAAVGIEDPRVSAMAAYRGRLFVATSDGSDGGGGGLSSFDGNNASRQGVLLDLARWADDYPTALAVFDGLLYLGMGRSGRVYASDGSSVWEAYDLASVCGADPGPLREMAVCGGRLHVGYRHPSVGAALLSKLGASAMGLSGGGSASREGWHTMTYTGSPNPAGVLGVYEGDLYLSRDKAGEAAIYRVNHGANALVGGAMYLSELDGGDPAGEKLLRRLIVSHSALGTGESVQVRYSLDGGAWTELIVSDEAGSTGKVGEFPAGTRCRRVALSVWLLPGSAVGSPYLTGISMEYARVSPGVKRRWQMDVRCEGVPGAMLRLLDGSLEASTGAQLSAALWAAKGKGVVGFEDVDGATYSVRFEGLEEDLGSLSEQCIIQSAVKCRLVEC